MWLMNRDDMITILNASESPDPNIRIVAAYALCFEPNKVLSNTAVAAIRRLAEDTDPEVQNVARSLLPYAEAHRIG
ncbi:hypothetical protein ACRAOD_16585 [Raoultella ornithinolytica]|uniref:hypothetical protein n=1 Tax=Raoultella ornithinolytica TaxID=54291 RepID=UPI0021BB531D|nr:hypothetical protein [Raoultella ornithinolytica]MCT8171502.1 hypothetical protein [Raoultella ornithinolytica]